MGTQFLTDTNAIIDFFKEDLPPSGIAFISSLSPKISIISYIELFSKSKLSDDEVLRLERFVKISTIYEVNHIIAQEAIKVRREYNVKLPDAIIAATAIYHNLTLVTRNTKDFVKIDGLELINPHDL